MKIILYSRSYQIARFYVIAIIYELKREDRSKNPKKEWNNKWRQERPLDRLLLKQGYAKA